MAGQVGVAGWRTRWVWQAGGPGGCGREEEVWQAGGPGGCGREEVWQAR